VVLPLQVEILYGPVNSRRLGKSLGINLMPATYKVCSFDCLYCHYGWTRVHTLDVRACEQDLPALDQVVERIRLAARSALDFDFLTFSGNGEPTLYPWFSELVDEVVRIRNEWRPQVRIALLSNSTTLDNPRVRDSITRIDYPLFKLDAAAEFKFRWLNRPAPGVTLDHILDHLASLPNINIQTLFAGGAVSNVEVDDVRAYYGQIARIRPREVHIYSIDRPVPDARLTLVPPRQLEEIARRGEAQTGVRMKAFYAAQK